MTRLRTALAVILALAAATATPAAGWAHSGDTAAPRLVALASRPDPIPSGATRVGGADQARTVSVSVALRPHDQAALDAFVAAVGDPASQLYRRFLTPAQYNERFAPTQADVDAVKAYLTGKGLKVTGVTGNRLVVTAKGSLAQATAAFGTTVSSYTAADGTGFFAPDRAPSVPSSLSGIVRAVAGLTDRAMFHHASGPAGPTGPGGGYTPAQLRKAYTMSTLSGAYDGTGETVGLIEFDGFKQADINTWTNQFGQPQVTPTVVAVDGGFPTPGSNQLEVTLDIDAVAAFAPKAAQIVYEAPNSDAAWVHEMARIASDNQITILSGSWLLGEKCESSPISASHDSYTQMVAQGVTLLSASGDWGATGCGYNGDNSTIQADYPASDPLFTGVGGTKLTTSDSAGTYSAETCWNQGGSGNTRSGGAYSSIYARPSWQTGSNQFRSVPDVSLLADYSAGALSVNTNGSWQSVGGTSLSSPLWAGYIAMVNQKARAAGKPRMGQLNPTVYGLATGSTYATLFHDVTSGTNGTYSAGTGYDLCTGWGSLKGDALADALVNGSTPPPADFTMSLSPTSGSITPGQSVSTTVSTVAGTTPTGAITLTASGAPSGVTVSFSPSSVNPGQSSTATITSTSSVADGTYPITVTGTAGSVTHTATYTLTVGSTPPPADFTMSLSPASGGVTAGQSTSTTVSTVAGSTPTGAITLTASGAPSGVTVSFSPATVNPGQSSTATITSASSTAAGTYTITVTGTAGSVTHSANYSLTVTVSTPTTLSLTNPGTLTGSVGTSLSVQLNATGGTTPYRFSATGLPAGLTLNTSTGVISGTPTTWANYHPTVRVTDAAGATSSATFYWFIFLY
ncbi:hypothetical protein Cs7R123_45640 [Catellatospora sp. TT07R-123]|uniref:protease pro-enzyme activation domain-containing protein n=1 Tax=Catellatospora sp. TT07R-123 TaxID=2733863 RepID=UPI001AFD414A|nr:protease pro-enzyme activation domain-containing protein [Catellatospora sp. TT07R-123]GHJ47222.1 hypothetical protein Cs7R123_45640 [Catellatospora sp. TT07R-123]